MPLKKPTGRPRAEPEARSKRIALRLTLAEHAEIEQAAATAQRKPSDLVRLLTLQAIRGAK